MIWHVAEVAFFLVALVVLLAALAAVALGA